MASIDNGNWLRSFLGTQFGTAQNNAIPTGEAWKQFLDVYNGLLPQLQQNLGNSTSLAWSPDGLPGIQNSLAQYQQNLPNLFSSITGANGNNSTNINNALMDAIFGNTAQVNNAFSRFNEGSGQGNDLFNTALGQMNNPYNQGMGDIGNYLLSTLGQTPYSQSQKDIANYGIKQGGYNDSIRGGIDAGQGLVNNQGMTDLLKQGAGIAGNLMGQGNNQIQQGLNYQNPFLTQGSQQALGLINNQGRTDNTQQGLDFIKQQLAQGAKNGNLQSGFDFANTLMGGGGVSDLTKQGGNLALQYAMGGGPSIYSEMPSWLQNINTNISVGGGGGFGGGGVGMPAVDSGYTGSLNEILSKAKGILDQNPLLSMEQAVSMARDQAATATQQQYKAMMGRALARGGGPGATVANGLQNQGMAEYADAGSQAEAAAMRDAAKTQQTLQLQKYGIGADLAKAMEQVAAQRNASSSSLAGQVVGANASLQAAGLQANSQAAQLQAQLQARMAEAQMGLYGQMAGLNLQKMLAGLTGVGNFANQENEMKLAGLQSLPALQNALTQKYAQDMGAYTNLTGQQSDLLKSGLSSLSGMQNTAEQAALGRAGIGKDVLGMGTDMFSKMAGLQGQNLATGFDAINKGNSNATANLNAYGNIFNNAQQNELAFTKLGADLTNSNVNNTNKLLDIMNNINQTNNNYTLGMGNLADKLWNTQMNGLNTGFNNSMNQDKLNLEKFNSFNTANQQTFGAQNNHMGNVISLINNSTNGTAGLANSFMNYLNTAQQGMYGVNPNAGGQTGFLGNLINTVVDNMTKKT